MINKYKACGAKGGSTKIVKSGTSKSGSKKR